MIIVLVEPQMAENIGMCARAMMNCGLAELRLVKPRDGWPNQKAWPAASGAMRILEQASAYETLADAIGDCHQIYATTARLRDQYKPVLTPREAMADIVARQQGGEKTALLFGPERIGLTNEHLQYANQLITVPLNPEYTSLNLAQAVLLLGWEWWQLQTQAAPSAQAEPTAATADELNHFLNRLITTLDAHGFFSTAQQKPAMIQNLRNIFLRNHLSAQEVRTLQGMITALTSSTR